MKNDSKRFRENSDQKGSRKQRVLSGRIDEDSGTDSDLLDIMNLLTPDRSYGIVMLRTHLVGAPLPKAVVVVGSSFGAQIQSLLVQAEVAPHVLRFGYTKTLIRCPKCEFERVPVSWPEIILNDTSVVILEINESAFFGLFNEPESSP